MKTKLTFFTAAFSMILSFLCQSCAHVGDTCDTYCLRHGGQCSHVDYGKSTYDTGTGDTKLKPTVFHCRFVN